MDNKRIPIIDLFAGPGGLGEGFTSLVDKRNKRLFRIALSIEKDEFAHQTLTLRSFLRQFEYRKFPPEYYEFLQSENKDIELLFNKYPEQAKKAKEEAWKFELGDPETHSRIDKRIKEALNGEKNFILIGGPPCQAYSLVGRARRQEGNGLNKEDKRVYLYREYYRILAEHQPPVFLMENVKGLLSSKVENEYIFRQLINDLQNPVNAYKKLRGEKILKKNEVAYKIYSLVKKPEGYDLIDNAPLFKPADFIIRSEEYGIPQTRHRVILLGIRSDLKVNPQILKPYGVQVPIEKVLTGLPPLRSGLSKEKDGKLEWKQVIQSIRFSTIKNEINSDIWKKMNQVIEKLVIPRKDRGNDYVDFNTEIEYKPEWFLDKNIKGVCNHETRSHIREDIYRYLFVSCFGSTRGHSPKLSDFPPSLLPKHNNVDKGVEENKFADRFRVQFYGEPSKTVTSHIAKDGHYFIHPEPGQCRSLTVREAARIQTFPDNYYFCGPRTEQYHQVGNAVPPFLAHQIAKIVYGVFAKALILENELIEA